MTRCEEANVAREVVLAGVVLELNIGSSSHNNSSRRSVARTLAAPRCRRRPPVVVAVRVGGIAAGVVLLAYVMWLTSTK